MGLDAVIDITAAERSTVLALLERYLPGTTAWVYGSRVKWTSTPQSDLDLVVFATPEQRPQVGDLREAFEQSNLPFRVDLFVWDDVSEPVRRRIEMEHVTLPRIRHRKHDDRWKEVPLGKLVDIFDGPHATPKKTTTGPVFLGISNLASGRLDLSQREYLSEDDYVRWTRRVTPRTNDIVFSYETRLGEAALIPKGLRACLGRRMGLLRPKAGAIDARFLLYAFLGENFQNTIRTRTVYGSTVDRIPLTDMGEFPIYVPQEIAEQRAIAHTLGILDDKIELNRRMNETLEAMARELFKSWFVDFDPVRAKMAGRDPGLPKHLADLFPDRLVDSPIGVIPRGWELRSLAEVAERLHDPCNPELTPDLPIDHFSIPAFDDGQTPRKEFGKHIRSVKLRVPANAVLLSKLNPEIERVWLADPTSDRQALCSTEFLVLHARSPFKRSFVYCLARSPKFRRAIEGLATGTSKSHQRARANAILSLQVAYPPSATVHAFDKTASGMLDRTLSLRREIDNLVDLRDTLLPKLVSGDVRIRVQQNGALTL